MVMCYNNIDTKNNNLDDDDDVIVATPSTTATSSLSKGLCHKKTIKCTVKLLDDSEMEIIMKKSSKGQALINRIYKYLQINSGCGPHDNEPCYFSCTYFDSTTDKYVWLIHDKQISQQIKSQPCYLKFKVKYYPDSPHEIKNEVIKNLMYQQIVKDVSEGRVSCSFATQSLLLSYQAQIEYGDWDFPTSKFPECLKMSPDWKNRMGDYELDAYENVKKLEIPKKFDSLKFELWSKVFDLYKVHRGQSREEATNNYLSNVSKVARYGMHTCYVENEGGNPVELCLCWLGLSVYDCSGEIRTTKLTWPRLLKIAYKRNKFIILYRQNGVCDDGDDGGGGGGSCGKDCASFVSNDAKRQQLSIDEQLLHQTSNNLNGEDVDHNLQQHQQPHSFNNNFRNNSNNLKSSTKRSNSCKNSDNYSNKNIYNVVGRSTSFNNNTYSCKSVSATKSNDDYFGICNNMTERAKISSVDNLRRNVYRTGKIVLPYQQQQLQSQPHQLQPQQQLQPHQQQPQLRLHQQLQQLHQQHWPQQFQQECITQHENIPHEIQNEFRQNLSHQQTLQPEHFKCVPMEYKQQYPPHENKTWPKKQQHCQKNLQLLNYQQQQHQLQAEQQQCLQRNDAHCRHQRLTEPPQAQTKTDFLKLQQHQQQQQQQYDGNLLDCQTSTHSTGKNGLPRLLQHPFHDKIQQFHRPQPQMYQDQVQQCQQQKYQEQREQAFYKNRTCASGRHQQHFNIQQQQQQHLYVEDQRGPAQQYQQHQQQRHQLQSQQQNEQQLQSLHSRPPLPPSLQLKPRPKSGNTQLESRNIQQSSSTTTKATTPSINRKKENPYEFDRKSTRGNPKSPKELSKDIKGRKNIVITAYLDNNSLLSEPGGIYDNIVEADSINNINTNINNNNNTTRNNKNNNFTQLSSKSYNNNNINNNNNNDSYGSYDNLYNYRTRTNHANMNDYYYDSHSYLQYCRRQNQQHHYQHQQQQLLLSPPQQLLLQQQQQQQSYDNNDDSNGEYDNLLQPCASSSSSFPYAPSTSFPLQYQQSSSIPPLQTLTSSPRHVFFESPGGFKITQVRNPEDDSLIETVIEKTLIIEDKCDEEEAIANAISSLTRIHPKLSVEEIEIKRK
ncbi:hypothetical protein HELRODRAFT_169705 [Helobdella robusta]|uniref:FERM domain-containing protein n=1 Tax=Helobdella robusta TaxID=6412 RepID=T1F290_HELRO|nr:hypothetical protein HELRODRAFT_169705 [Helobdella robusta]ESO07987.1 hypothetical protein HELRODRAFT_169705 [Helobdella robusta]